MRVHSTLMSLVVAGMIGSGLPGTAGLIPVGPGWAGSSVNAVVFRRNSVVTHGQDQVVAYYDEDGVVTLARRQLESTTWGTPGRSTAAGPGNGTTARPTNSR